MDGGVRYRQTILLAALKAKYLGEKVNINVPMTKISRKLAKLIFGCWARYSALLRLVWCVVQTEEGESLRPVKCSGFRGWCGY